MHTHVSTRRIADFSVLTVELPSVSSFPKPSLHYLYIRKHDPKIPHPDSLRSLFVANVPIDATANHFRNLWANKLGGARVEHVEFGEEAQKKVNKSSGSATEGASYGSKKNKKRKRNQPKPEDIVETEDSRLPLTWDATINPSGGTAVVVFVDKPSANAGMSAVQKAAKITQVIPWQSGLEGKTNAVGSERYRAHHQLQFPDVEDLQTRVDQYMERFASIEQARARKNSRLREMPDDDGFITVTRGGRIGPARLEEAQKKAEEQKEKNKGKEDFYRFQVREKKKAEAGHLLKAFEEDKRKMYEMRRRRNKFRDAGAG
ncbi:MAG: Meiotic recombination protein dmc1 [Bogoriella megaspora]|nr:MAG: Meiotic recombination protein dmc1 [Bogoriella megaspora]